MLMTLNFVYPLTLAVLEIKIMMYQGRQAFHLLDKLMLNDVKNEFPGIAPRYLLKNGCCQRRQGIVMYPK